MQKQQSSMGFSSEHTSALASAPSRSQHLISPSTHQSEVRLHLISSFFPLCSWWLPRADVSTSLFPKIHQEHSLCAGSVLSPGALSKTGPPSSALQGRGKQIAERRNRDGFSPTPHSHDRQTFKVSKKPVHRLEVPFNSPQPKGNL